MKTLVRTFLVATLAIVPGATALPPGATANETDMRARLVAEFVKYDPLYEQKHELFQKRLHAVAADLGAAQAGGKTLYCSQQMYLEARWLHKYTALWDELEDKLRRIEISLSDDTQDFANEQSPVNGLWGACYENAVLRLGATGQELERYTSRGEMPLYPIDLRRSTGRTFLTRLQDLLVSEIASNGIDHRGELGNFITTLAQASFKPYIRQMLPELVEYGKHTSARTMDEIFRFFLAGAQDHDTGYWGAWYIIADQILQTADLSITFHIVKYSKGEVAMWPQIVETTLAIEDEPYPYGWRSNGRWTNHNLYDVAAIFRYGWDHMTTDQQEIVSAKLREMIEWSITNTVTDEGTFAYDPTYSDSFADVYYFGIAFFDMVGLWDRERRFWSGEVAEVLLSRASCPTIHRRLLDFDFEGWAGDGARAKIAKSCEPAPSTPG